MIGLFEFCIFFYKLAFLPLYNVALPTFCDIVYLDHNQSFGPRQIISLLFRKILKIAPLNNFLFVRRSPALLHFFA